MLKKEGGPYIKKEHYYRQVNKLRKVLQGPCLYDFLAHLYSPYEILERCGKKYPVAILDKAVRKIYPHDAIVVAPAKWQMETSGFIINDPSYRIFCRHAGASIIPNETYSMVQVEQTPRGLAIQCNLGRYDLMLDTCDCLEWEILKVLSETSDWQTMLPEDLLERLKLRKTLHSGIKNPLIDGTGRSTALAVSVVTVFPAGDEHYLWMGRKSTKGVSANAGKMHVIPSFMFQPEQGDRNEEFCLLHNIRREFLEELFHVRPPKDASYSWFFAHKPIQYLDKMFETGEAEIWLTGIIVNLFNLRPEICTLLRIKTPRWYADHTLPLAKPGEYIQINEEFASASPGQRSDNAKRFAHRVPFSGSYTDRELFGMAALDPGNIVPAGAAAFWLGVDALRKFKS